MKLKSINSPEFRKYGMPLMGYDFNELLGALARLPIPESGIVYEASVGSLESCSETEKLQKRGFGNLPIQLGYVGGSNAVLDCLEYHKSSEFNIALDDVILVLGDQRDIKDGKLDTKDCEAFLIPAGQGVELYATTLHYAPFGKGYRVICVLPRGTNLDRADIPLTDSVEDRMYFGANKWLMTHPEAAEKNPGAYVGLTGDNITDRNIEQ